MLACVLVFAYPCAGLLTIFDPLRPTTDQVVEFGAPVELMAKDGGSFRQLCERSGEMAVLQEMSQAAHQARLDKTEQR